ncbi:hypothetical protein [Pilimelia columellifera]|uniref:Lipoprotein LpqE n=1 Tax=Pilimelia columellifera subsp. columellifera TaxID=706583 RepID=A0ABN3NDP3_9ACTN
MTRSTNRRGAALLAGAALTASLLVSGCSAGQIAETAKKRPSVAGVNASASLPDGGVVSVRDAVIVFDSHGYPKGGTAPLSLSLFNDTTAPVTVRASVRPDTGLAHLVGAESVTLVQGRDAAAAAARHSAGKTGDAAASASPIATPSAARPSASPAGGTAKPAGDEAQLSVPVAGTLALRPGQESFLQVVGLSAALKGGMGVPLRFDFSNGLVIDVDATVSTPLTPLPRQTGGPDEGGH